MLGRTSRTKRNIRDYCVDRVLNKLLPDERDELKGIYEMGLVSPKAAERGSLCAREWAREHSRNDVVYHAGLTVSYALRDITNDLDDLMSCIDHFAVACGYDTYSLDAGVHTRAKVEALQEVLRRALA